MRLRRRILAAILAFQIATAPSPNFPAEDAFGTVRPLGPGFEGRIYALSPGTGRLPDFRQLTPVGTVYTRVLNVPQQDFRKGFPGVTDRIEWFAIRYSGLFEIPEGGEHRFRLVSDDGSRLIIDDRVVIDNDGLHPTVSREATVTLAPGVHCIRVDYFQGPRYHVALQLFMARGKGSFAPFDIGEYEPRLTYLPGFVVGAGASAIGAYPDPLIPPLRRFRPWAPRAPWQAPGWQHRWHGTTGRAAVSPDVAAEMLRNWFSGRPPFRPDLGRGAVSWFVTEGDPYVGRQAAAGTRVLIPARILAPEAPLTIDSPTLEQVHGLYQRTVAPEAIADAQANWQALVDQNPNYRNQVPDALSSNNRRTAFNQRLRGWAEAETWEAIGEATRGHPSQAARVMLQDTYLSRQGNGEFMTLAEAERIRINMSPLDFYDGLSEQGVLERLAPEARAEVEATRLSLQRAAWVRTGFRYGGRALLVVGAANDIYRIAHSPNRARTTTEVAGGWAGAIAFSSAFATWFAPADVAGPVAWIAHGLGTLVAGGIGYMVGSYAGEKVYEGGASLLEGDTQLAEQDTRCFDRR